MSSVSQIEFGIADLVRLDYTESLIFEIPGICWNLDDCAWRLGTGFEKDVEHDRSDIPSCFNLLCQLLCGAHPQTNAHDRQSD